MFNGMGMGMVGRRGGDAPAVDLSQGLVAHYLLNNNADDSHSIYDGISSNIDFQGDRVAIDGTSYTGIITSSAIIPDNDFVFTYSFWLSTTESSITTSIAVNGDGTTNAPHVHEVTISNNGYIAFTEQNVSEWTLPSINDGDLHHVVCVRDNDKVRIYIDSILRLDKVTVMPSNSTGTRAFQIANPNRATDYNFNGNLSNFRIYNEAKDQTFINALYGEGYYPKPLPLPTTDGLVAHYPLTGTAEDTTGNYDGTEVSATYVDDVEFGSVFSGTGNITINTTAISLSVWCCYWINSGSGWVFTKTATIPTSLSTNKYKSLRLYSITPNIAQQDEIEEYEKNFRPIDIDDGLVTYYPLAANSFDNYGVPSQYDGTDTSMTYDGLSGLFNGVDGRVGITPSMISSFSLTFSAWVKTTVGGHVIAFGKEINTINQVRMGVGATSGVVFGVIRDSTTTDIVPGTTDIRDGLWHQISFTVTSTELKCYLDGVLDGEFPNTATFPILDTAYIGVLRYYGQWNGFFNGAIAKARIYNKALTAEQVEAIYNTEKGDFI